jgi:hypothetical protein
MSETVYLICIYPDVRRDMKSKCMIRTACTVALRKNFIIQLLYLAIFLSKKRMTILIMTPVKYNNIFQGILYISLSILYIYIYLYFFTNLVYSRRIYGS